MSDSPDVLFVVIDSARKDRVSTYGHHRSTTPTLDELAGHSTRFEQAFTPAPWTLPSHASLFTGLYPSEHGVTNGFAEALSGLPEALPTMAEILAERGYRTAGFSNNPWVGQLSGLDRGFAEFVEWDLEISGDSGRGFHTSREELLSRGHRALGFAQRTPVNLLKRRFFTDQLVRRAGRWLDAAPDPAFTFLNLMEAHSPYYPPKRAFQELGLRAPGPIEARKLNLQLTAYVLGKRTIDDIDERVLEFYDASLRYQDRKLATLLQTLRDSGRYDQTLIIVCADHGKTLGDYERSGLPPHYLQRVNTNVPLFVKLPGQTEDTLVEEPFELVNLFDLVTAGSETIPTGDPAIEGALVEDFIPHTGRDAADVTHWRGLADADGTFIRSEAGDEYLLGHPDGDRRDLHRTYRDRLDARVSKLEEQAWDDETTRVVDDNVQSQLKELGYLD